MDVKVDGIDTVTGPFAGKDMIPYPYITTHTLISLSNHLIHASIVCKQREDVTQTVIYNLGELMTYIPLTNRQVNRARIRSVCIAYVVLMYKCLVFQGSIPGKSLHHNLVYMLSSYLYERVCYIKNAHTNRTHTYQQNVFAYIIKVRMIVSILKDFEKFTQDQAHYDASTIIHPSDMS